MRDALTLPDLVRRRALEHGARRAFVFLADGEQETASLTYEALDQGARAIAAGLRARGLSSARVLLLYGSGLDFVTTFLGCLYAGAVAVPMHPPRPNHSLQRLRSIVNDARPALVLSTAAVRSRCLPLCDRAGLSDVVWLTAEDVIGDDESDARIDSDTLAFLQYTSGSTADPKGVMVTHGNLLANHRMIQTAFAVSAETTIVTWLPLFHDMGLIGNALQSLYSGTECTIMPPEAFLMRPARWLRAIARYRGRLSGAPNFAYDLCVRKIKPEDRADLDLSSWETAFCGSEPVRAETMARFAEAFAPCGLHPEALFPCYGLAEGTLFVAGGTRATGYQAAAFRADALEQHRAVRAEPGADDVRTLVSCGHTWLDQEIVVVNPDTFEPCPADSVGEIWISGPNVADGYWNNPEETLRTLQARLGQARIARKDGPFLRTGDLGFFHDDDLYIAGRLKDLVIIAGRNHHPADIEYTVEAAHPAVRTGCSAAFSVEVSNEERLVVVVELDRAASRGSAASDVEQAVRRAVAQHHDASVYAVVPIEPATCPRTSSGKVQRHVCRARFLAGTLEVCQATGGADYRRT